MLENYYYSNSLFVDDHLRVVDVLFMEWARAENLNVYLPALTHLTLHCPAKVTKYIGANLF